MGFVVICLSVPLNDGALGHFADILGISSVQKAVPIFQIHNRLLELQMRLVDKF